MTEDSQDTRMQEKEVSFEEFKAFYEEFPESTTKDLYETFPNNKQGTIRGWKTRVKRDLDSAQTQAPQQESHQNFIIKGLCNDLGVEYNALKAMGLSYNAELNYLQQKSIDRELNKDSKKKGVAGGILPNPIGSGANEGLGIEEYIMKFDGIMQKMEIEIPFDILYDKEAVQNLTKRKVLSREAQKRKQKFRFA